MIDDGPPGGGRPMEGAFYFLMNDRNQPVTVKGDDKDGTRALAVFSTVALAERTRLEFGYDTRVAGITEFGIEWWIATCRDNEYEWITIDWFGEPCFQVFRLEALRDIPGVVEGRVRGFEDL